MNLKARFSLIGSGIIIFLIITPLLVLFARGFKYDFAQHKLVETGTLVVKSDPTKAIVSLDGENESGLTPAVVRFLTPKDYEIRVTKADYQPWVKRLPINAQYVTWAALGRDVITLFLLKPKIEWSQPAASVSVSKDETEIFFTNPQGLAQTLNISSGLTATLGNYTPGAFPDLADPKLVWTNATKNFEIMISKVLKPVPTSILNKTTYSESDGNEMILLSAGDLYLYNLTSTDLIAHQVTAATLSTDGVWYVQNHELHHVTRDLGPADLISDQLPDYKTASLIRGDNRIYLLLDQTLYTINETIESIYSPVTFAQWDPNSSQLLYGNNNEIKIYNPDTKNSQLVLRSLVPVSNPVLNVATGYVFYQQENKIEAIELDDRNGQNVYTILDEGKPSAWFALSNDGRELYLFDRTNLSQWVIR